jgi:Tfp pilus assembly protein PilF
LLLALGLVYAPIVGHDWVSYDDEQYLLANPHVRQGLDWGQIRWVFAHAYAGNYHPLTWLSHMLDVELFGLRPAPHHLVNVGLHALNAVLVLFLLAEVFSCPLLALFGAGFFALHPLRVESVAWAAERKDVLCAAFFLAASWLYLRYGRRPTRAKFAGVSLLLALALLAKPMAVTLPLVFLLFDRWPLARVEAHGWRALLLEKLPWFALAGLAALATLWAQRAGGATSSVAVLPLDLRLLNAAASVWTYVRQTVFPSALSVFYPHAVVLTDAPRQALLWPALAGVGLVGVGILVAWKGARRFPALALGTAYFLVTLLPVLGIVQVGTQAHADRYTYLPTLGLGLVLLGLAERWATRRALGIVAGVVLAALSLRARAQLGHWRDTRALFEHALEVEPRNYLAHSQLGELALAEGDVPAARAAFERALALHPRFAHALGKLALCALAEEHLEEAERRLDVALSLDPVDGELNLNRAVVALERGELAEAERRLTRCAERDPSDPDVLFNLGVVALRAQRPADAEARFEQTLALAPEHADAWSNLGQVRLARSNGAGARAAFQRAAELLPNDPLAHFNLGVACRTLGDVTAARAAFVRALELDSTFELARTTLAALEDKP